MACLQTIQSFYTSANALKNSGKSILLKLNGKLTVRNYIVQIQNFAVRPLAVRNRSVTSGCGLPLEARVNMVQFIVPLVQVGILGYLYSIIDVRHVSMHVLVEPDEPVLPVCAAV